MWDHHKARMDNKKVIVRLSCYPMLEYTIARMDSKRAMLNCKMVRIVCKNIGMYSKVAVLL